MIINIPLSIDDAHIENKLQTEYEKEVLKHVEKRLNSTLARHSENRYRYGYRDEELAKDGFEVLIRNSLQDFLDENKDTILKIAGEELAKRLARTKRGKELLEVSSDE